MNIAKRYSVPLSRNVGEGRGEGMDTAKATFMIFGAVILAMSARVGRQLEKI